MSDDTSKLPGSPGRYGQNQFPGASSDLPGQNSTSGYLSAPDLAQAMADTIGSGSAPDARGKSGKGAPHAASKGGTIQGPQKRAVSTSNVPTGFGQLGPAPAQGKR